MAEPSDNPFRRPSRAGPDPAADRPAGPDPQGAPTDGAPPADAGPPPSGTSPERHPPTGDGGDPVDAANSIWSQLHDDVAPPSEEGDHESKVDASEPGLPGDSLGAPPPSDPVADPVAQAESVVLDDFVTLAAERDDYLLQLQRLKADFDNYRKRVIKQQSEQVDRAAEALVSKLLEVLDTFDLALAHGEGFDQVHSALFGVLEKEGLERLDPAGAPFDPNESDAVAHEEGDGGPVVSDVLRAGYRWKGRVLRPAMVKVRG